MLCCYGGVEAVVKSGHRWEVLSIFKKNNYYF